MPDEATSSTTLRIEKAVYGGDGLARTPAGEVVLLPFVLPGELVVAGRSEPGPEVIQTSPERVEPRCVHFGVCGGCQYQMSSYDAQLAMKAAILQETLERAGAEELPEIQVTGSPGAYGYRNRIRLRVREGEGEVRLGYNTRGSSAFLPITMCPIAAPVLWQTAEAVIRAAREDEEVGGWLRGAAELEISCDPDGAKVQLHLLCIGAVPQRKGSFERFAQRVLLAGVPVTSMGASKLHVASGRAMASLATWGADGLTYHVGEDKFWLRRGSFFQVNRLLVPRMLQLVCGERSGELAWDLYAGVGLFARTLARRFKRVTAVEASPVATDELRKGLRRPDDQTVQETTLSFLRRAVVQRDRPQLVVLDPPRAGAGEESCALLLSLKPEEIVYVSCDPTTLARDLAVLAAGYNVAELHMIDLFPQTYHLETVMVLRRRM